MNQVFTITLNPCFDVTIFTDNLEDDKVNRVLHETREPAGKGINVAKVLHTLSVPVKCYGMLGSNSTFEYLRLLGDNAGDTFFVPIPGNVRENIIIRTELKTYKINRQGADYNLDDCTKLIERILSEMEKDDIVVLSGSKPHGISNEDFITIAKHFKAAGARVAIDCDFLSANELSEIKPWLIKPNNHELENLLNTKLQSTDDIIKASEKLCGQGIENILISMGADGLAGITHGETKFIKGIKVELKSTIGAGDSTLAGFIFAELNGYHFTDKIRFAAACGTAKVMYEGAISPPIETIYEVLEKINK